MIQKLSPNPTQLADDHVAYGAHSENTLPSPALAPTPVQRRRPKLGQKHYRVAQADLPGENFRGQLLSSVEELETLVPAWQRLMEVAVHANPYFDPSFLIPAIEQLGNDNVSVLAIYADQRNTSNGESVLCALLPVVRKRMYGLPVRSLEVWKHDQCFDSTPLVRFDCRVPAWAFLLDYVHGELGASLLSLDTVLAEGEFAQLVTDHCYNHRPPVFHRDGFTRACFRPTEDAESFINTKVAKSTRRSTKRMQRKLTELGNLKTDVIDAWDAGVADDFLQLEAAGWKGESGSALASTPATDRFFKDMLRRSLDAQTAVVLRTSLDDRPIAMLVVLQSTQSAAQFKIAFDEQLKDYSPGLIVEFEEIQRLFADGIEFADSCADPNHSMINRVWSDRVHYQSLVLGSDRIASRVAVSVMAGIQQAKFFLSK